MNKFNTITHKTENKGKSRQRLPTTDDRNFTTEQSLDDFGKYNFVHSFQNDSECGSSSAAFSQGYGSVNKRINRKLAEEFENEDCLGI